MGIYTRYTTAVLTLFLSAVPLAYSATQVKTPVSTFSNIMNSAQGAIGLPYGDAAFFGPEFVAEHTAGSRFQAGQSIPGAGSSGAKVKVAIKPVVTINPPKLASSVVGTLKGGALPVLIATEAVTWAIEQLPGATYDPQTGELVKNTGGNLPPSGDYYTFTTTGNVMKPERYSEPLAACRANIPTSNNWFPRVTETGSSTYRCDRIFQGWYCPDCPPEMHGTVGRKTETCANGWNADTLSCSTEPGGRRPFNDDDYQGLQDAISRVTNSDWLRDLTKAKCEGSLSPERCYQDLVDRRPNHGPASQTGPATSTTTTRTNPDGTTTTTTTTTRNKYDYTYTENTFNYKTTTTITTTTDGETTTEVIEDTSDPDNPPADEPAQDDEDLSFDDPDMPEVEPFYDQKYPDGLEGVWEARKTEFENSAFIDFLRSFVPSFSGSCPGWSVNVNIASWANFGVHEFQSLCWVFDFIKVVFLVSAGFLCRALIFGG